MEACVAQRWNRVGKEMGFVKLIVIARETSLVAKIPVHGVTERIAAVWTEV